MEGGLECQAKEFELEYHSFIYIGSESFCLFVKDNQSLLIYICNYKPTSLPVKDTYKLLSSSLKKLQTAYMLKASSGGCCREHDLWEAQGRSLENIKEALFFSPWLVHTRTHKCAQPLERSLPPYKAGEIKPDVFVYFILAAFQVFKILANILS